VVLQGEVLGIRRIRLELEELVFLLMQVGLGFLVWTFSIYGDPGLDRWFSE
jgi:nitrate reductase NapE component